MRPRPPPIVVDRLGRSVVREADELELDVRAHRPGVRVEDDDRSRALLVRDLDATRERLDRTVERQPGNRRRVADLVARVLVRGRDRRAGERVVELVEEEELPRLRQLPERVRHPAERVGQRRPLLGAQEEVLGPSVPALDAGVRRVAADAVVLELAAMRRPAPVADGGEEPPGRAQLHGGKPAGRVEACDRVQVGLRRAAAVVADAVEDHQLGRVGRQLRERLVDVVAEVGAG
jgi:hypothetical protein